MPKRHQKISKSPEARRAHARRASLFVGNIQHPVTTAFGAALRARRLQRGLTQAELAEIAGLNRSYISEVENGQQSISLERADRLAKAVGSQLTELLGRSAKD